MCIIIIIISQYSIVAENIVVYFYTARTKTDRKHKIRAYRPQVFAIYASILL